MPTKKIDTWKAGGLGPHWAVAPWRWTDGWTNGWMDGWIDRVHGKDMDNFITEKQPHQTVTGILKRLKAL